jgi:2,3-bisphosphoglycerate-independent phosphoglycerate mutase
MTHTTAQKPPRPVVLCILDGWGHRDTPKDNAIALAKTPVWDDLMAHAPLGWLRTSGLAVGLPEGQMGNSEVGHMNLGGGRVVMQDLPRIDAAVANGELAKNPGLLDFIEKLKKSGGTAHVMGLLSPGGVHSHQDHIAALAQAISTAGIPVRIHAFLDGRDTPPKSALQYLAKFQADIAGLKDTAIATVCGRYYAMDRDKRWERVEKAYACLTAGEGHRAATPAEAVEHSYAADGTDEFVLPAAIGGYTGMADGDGVLMANFRADRAREILTALLDPAFDGFNRTKVIAFAAAAGMVEYSQALNPFLITLFAPLDLKDTLGEIVAARGLKQLRIAETEKYAHVTFFFNGGVEDVFPGEDRILVPSPKVATYDLQPEMSAPEVTDKLVAAIGSGKYDLIVVNYANPDMVGHTGVLSAAIKAAETVDHCLGRLKEAVEKAGGAMLITADHGNLEMMMDDESGQPHTAHTTFDVPVILVGRQNVGGLRNGALADVAPTVLSLMGIPQPAAMTGVSLLADGVRREERIVAAGA